MTPPRPVMLSEFNRINRSLARRGAEPYPVDPETLPDDELASVLAVMELEYRTLAQVQAEQADLRRASRPHPPEEQ